MENFELLRYVVIGQYLPRESFVHRMDPAVKLLALVVAVLGVAFAGSYAAAAAFLVLSGVCLAASRVPVAYALSGLRPVLWLFGVFIVLELFFYQPTAAAHSPLLFAWGPARVTALSVRVTAVALARVVSFLLLLSAYTLTTRVSDMSRGVERLLSPLKAIGLPAGEIALVFTIALRFVPTFAMELERLMKAQASRGAGRRRTGRWNPLAQARARLPLVVPLFITALGRADDLVEAMESRCYVPSGSRSVYRSHAPTVYDGLALAAVCAVTVALTVLPMPA